MNSCFIYNRNIFKHIYYSLYFAFFFSHFFYINSYMEKSKNINSELMYYKGVGPRRAEALAAEGLNNGRDLLLNFPRAYISRDASDDLRSLAEKIKETPLQSSSIAFLSTALQREVIVIAKITSKKEHNFGKRKLLSLQVSDGSGASAKIQFWQRTEYFAKLYSTGMLLSISGKPELDNYGLSFTHPEIDIIDEEEAHLYGSGAILPKYKLTEPMRKAGITMRLMRDITANAIAKELNYIQETLPDNLLEKYSLPNLKSAVNNLHFPKNNSMLEKSRYRIKFEEILLYLLIISIKKFDYKNNEQGYLINPKSKSARELYDALPFELTKDQKKVINEIAKDMNSGVPMNRLLQGDVGSGKTIVSVLTILMATDCGYQTALMAPTEILAEQHFHTLKKLLPTDKFHIVQLVGGQKTKLRRQVNEDISSGKANIIVGTHAMFQSDIAYNNLGLVIIDEQHRFGVAQRAELIKLAKESYTDKSKAPHILVMTATPIPRTLTMTLHGDLDVSIIKSMPKNRKPILTKVAFESNRDEVYEFIKSEIELGRQAFIVYPLVEKSEKLELKAATEHFEELKEGIFKEYKCGLLHGQMFWYEKEEAMSAFLNKEYDILVSTTVIEVGIDIPNSSVMLIENAERFGLSQLHQLRGRVGRGTEQSFCILMTKDNFKFLLGKKTDLEKERTAAIVRLKTMEETTDGFVISEVDMKLRGPGDIIGTKQSGLPEFKYADLVQDVEIIQTAKQEAEEIVSKDPHLKKLENKLLRNSLLAVYSETNFLEIA